MPKVYVLGSGVDATTGIEMPLSNELLPRITEFLTTDQGKILDGKLRSMLPQLRFRFDSFIEKAIDNMARNFNDEVANIQLNVSQELQMNNALTEEQRSMGRLINRMMEKVTNMAAGAQLDEETADLIRQVLGDVIVTDDSIIDLDKIVFTSTFQSVVRTLLTKSLANPNDPILRHMNKNFLDIERLLVKYFVGFFIGKEYDIKIYCYIAWMLWAFLLTKEQEVINSKTAEELTNLSVYSQIETDSVIINFNYTTFAKMFVANHHGSEALYFHGSLLDYVDIKRKQDFQHDIATFKDFDIQGFFDGLLRQNISFDEGNKRFTIPSFMPPVSLKPVMSQQNIVTWYKTYESLKAAEKIIIVGYSFNSSDEHFNGMLRECRNKPVIIIDTNVEAIKMMLFSIYGTRAEDYSPIFIQGYEAFVHDNLKIIKANAHEINYTQL